MTGKLEYMKCLLEAGADIDYADAREKLTPVQVCPTNYLASLRVVVAM